MHNRITLSHIKLSAAMLTQRYFKKHACKRHSLKQLVLCTFVVLVAACSSQPTENSFVGPGEFNPIEAAKTRVSLGLTYLKNGNFSQAKFNLDKALEFAPRSGEANYAMAFYYQQVDEVARAEEYYQTAIGYSRNDPDVLNSYGAFLCKQGNYEKAKEYFLRAVDNKSYISTAETYENLAICTQSEGRNEEAIEYFNSALNHQPTRASSLFYLAQLYTKMQQWEEAKKALWKYERNSQVSADSLWMSYEIAQGQNNLKAATEYADLLKSMYPSHQYTLTALAQLGKFRPSMSVTQKSRPQTPALETLAEESSIAETVPSQAFEPTINTAPASEEITTVASTEVEAAAVVRQTVKNDAPNTLDSAALDAYHIVLPKENLYRISLKYNVKMKKLLEWNNLKDAAAIRIGTKLRVRDPNINE